MLHDLRFALRLLRGSPWSTATAVLTLALGIGATTAIFGVADGMLFRPLPYRQPDRLVLFQGWSDTRHASFTTIAQPFVRAARESHRGLSGVATFDWPGRRTLVTADRAVVMAVAEVSVNLLDVLGVRPGRGRDFTAGDAEPGVEPVALVTTAAWRRLLGGDPGVVGARLRFEEGDVRVVGVLPDDFVYPYVDDAPDVLVPADELDTARPSARAVALARLAPAVTVAEAQAGMDGLVRGVRESFPGLDAGTTVRLAGLQEGIFGRVRPVLWLLLGAAGFVLLIACVNVANLLIAGALARGRELAVRAAMGASRARLARHLVAESAVLAALGATTGWLVARWTFGAVMALLPERIWQAMPAQVNARALLVATGLALVATLASGVAPAWGHSRPDVLASLRESGGGIAGGGSRARSVLVATEVALGLVLLSGAGLLLNSFVRMRQVDWGFELQKLFTVSVVVPANRYPTRPARFDFHREVLAGLQSLPDAASAGGASGLPLQGAAESALFPDAPSSARGGVWPVTAGYLPTLGARFVAGRPFSEEEERQGADVAVINVTAARRLDIVGQPLGARVRIGGRGIMEVVGIVADLRQSYAEEAEPAAYVPYDPETFRVMRVVVRSAAGLGPVTEQVRATIHRIDARVPVAVAPFEQVLAGRLAEPRLEASVVGVFGALALVLAAVGIYGVAAQAASRRVREIGLRMALGADASAVRRLVVGQALAPVAAGLAAGLAAALLLSRVLASRLFGVTPHDPATLAAVMTVLGLAAVVAIYPIVRRAVRVDPMVALRSE